MLVNEVQEFEEVELVEPRHVSGLLDLLSQIAVHLYPDQNPLVPGAGIARSVKQPHCVHISWPEAAIRRIPAHLPQADVHGSRNWRTLL